MKASSKWIVIERRNSTQLLQDSIDYEKLDQSILDVT